VDLVRSLVVSGVLAGVHDVSTGGLAVALAEMAVRSGVGVDVAGVPDTSHLFAELPSRAVLAVAADQLDAVLAQAGSAGVPAVVLGRAGGDRVRITTGHEGHALIDLDLVEVTTAWRDRLPEALGTGTTQA
jgi:phosphoribosylformylglycinamidine synthase